MVPIFKYISKIRSLFNFGFDYFEYSFIEEKLFHHYNPQKKHRVIRNILDKNFSKLIKEYKSYSISSAEGIAYINKDLPIWVFWQQGIDKMPPIVRASYESILKHSSGHKVILLSMDNIKQYVNIPDWVYAKLKNNKISSALFSDILRNSLLYQHGGIWMDATIFLTSDFDLSEYKVFSIHHKQSETTYVSMSRWTSFFLAGIPNNPFNGFIRAFLLEYVKRYDRLIDYHLIDYTIDCGYRNFDWFRDLVESFPLSNPDIYYFQRHINEVVNNKAFDRIIESTYIHKLDRRVKAPENTDALYYKLLGIKQE